MQIRTVKLESWKGVTRDFTIGKLNLLSGPNGGGKTGLLSAIQWAITGKTSLGGTNDDTLQLCGPRGAWVEIELDDGFTFRRRLVWDAKESKASVELDIAGRPAGGIRKTEPILLEHVGDFPVMFDLGAFRALAPDKRRAFVLQLCSQAAGGGAVDVDDIMRRIYHQVLRGYLGEATVDAFLAGRYPDGMMTSERRLQANSELSLKLPDAFRVELALAMNVVRDELQGDLASAVAASIEKADAGKNARKADRDRSHAAAQEIAARKAELTVSAESAESLKARRSEVIQLGLEIEGQIKLQEGKAAARNSLTQRIENTTHQLGLQEEHLRELMAMVLPTPVDALALEHQADELEKSAVAVPDLSGLEQAHQQAMRANYTESVRLSTARIAHATHTGEHNRLVHRLEEIQNSKAAQLGEAWDAADKHCYAHFETSELAVRSWNELKSLVVQFSQTPDTQPLVDQIRASNEKLVQLGDAVIAAQKAAAEAKEREEAAGLDLNQAREASAFAVAERGNTLVQVKALRQKAAEIADGWRRHNLAIANGTQRIDEIRANLVGAEKDLNALDAEGGHVPTEQLTQRHEELRSELKDLDLQIDRKGRHLQLERELTQCAANAERQQVAFEVYEAVGKAIRSLREQLMYSLVAPLLDNVNHFLCQSWPHLQAFCDLANDRGKPIFELGWRVRCEYKVRLPAMSGGQMCIFGSALLYAMTCIKSPPLKILGVEAAELDTVQEHKLLDALAGVSGALGNVFYASPQPIIPAPKWNMIHITDADWTREESRSDLRDQLAEVL